MTIYARKSIVDGAREKLIQRPGKQQFYPEKQD